MSIEPIGKILKKIKRRFDADPENWQVVSGVDKLGNKDLFIGQQPRLWQIKSKPLSPLTSIAMGTSVRHLMTILMNVLASSLQRTLTSFWNARASR